MDLLREARLGRARDVPADRRAQLHVPERRVPEGRSGAEQGAALRVGITGPVVDCDRNGTPDGVRRLKERHR